LIESLKNKLKSAVNFPSPPAVAQQIIELASDPDIDVTKVASAIAKDPGLTAKILRVANSPLYSKQRKSDNLRQALVVLGLNAATTLALSFSLVGTYKGVKGSGIDYIRYWRRTILCASAAQAFAAFKRLNAVEDVFLAALLQDIAVIAIDKVRPDFYAELPKEATHADFIAHELKQIGADHAALGSWLLDHWKLAVSLCRTVAASHAPESVGDTAESMSARCVALGSDCVEILMAIPKPMDLTALSAHAQAWIGMGPQDLAATLEKIVAQIPEVERLFDTSLLNPDAGAAMIEQAREILTIRNLQAIEQVSALQQSSEYFKTRAAELEDKHRRDPLTGVFNRRHMDEVLANEFNSAVEGRWPLSVVFADLDRFKQVNDTYGHPAGDTVLIEIAKLLLEVVRASDCVARYGGEEFLMILPGTGVEDAQKVCERLLKRLRATRHVFAAGTLNVTASLGLATLSPSTPFPSVFSLIEAADRSVYAAKRAGRDRLVCYEARRWLPRALGSG
jgi:diguanylate cyclase (GGDEF)-like protein